MAGPGRRGSREGEVVRYTRVDWRWTVCGECGHGRWAQIEHTKVCDFCGREFRTVRKDARQCGRRACYMDLKRESYRRWRAALPPSDKRRTR